MVQKFDEKMFIKTAKELKEVIPFLPSEKCGEKFLDTVRFHCNVNEYDFYVFVSHIADTHIPEVKKELMDVVGWKNVYKSCIFEHKSDKLGEILTGAMKIFDKIETFQSFFEMTAEIWKFEMDIYIGAYLLHKIGCLSFIDSLLKIEDTGSETKEVTVISEVETVKKEEKEFDVMESEPVECVHLGTLATVPEPIECNMEEPLVSEGSEPAVPEPLDDDCMDGEPTTAKTPVTKPSHSKKADRSKRGYNIPVHQYRRIGVFDNLEDAMFATGTDKVSILSTIDTKPVSQTDTLWKYGDKGKKTIVQYRYLHTYSNQNEINTKSMEVCGKRIYHSNIDVKNWKSIYKGEYLWLQMESDENLLEAKELAA